MSDYSILSGLGDVALFLAGISLTASLWALQDRVHRARSRRATARLARMSPKRGQYARTDHYKQDQALDQQDQQTDRNRQDQRVPAIGEEIVHRRHVATVAVR